LTTSTMPLQEPPVLSNVKFRLETLVEQIDQHLVASGGLQAVPNGLQSLSQQRGAVVVDVPQPVALLHRSIAQSSVSPAIQARMPEGSSNVRSFAVAEKRSVSPPIQAQMPGSSYKVISLVNSLDTTAASTSYVAHRCTEASWYVPVGASTASSSSASSCQVDPRATIRVVPPSLQAPPMSRFTTQTAVTPSARGAFGAHSAPVLPGCVRVKSMVAYWNQNAAGAASTQVPPKPGPSTPSGGVILCPPSS